MNCPLCDKPVNQDDPETWKQVIGWVGGPRKDSMRLREDTGKFAHDRCVILVQRGQDPNSPDLFDEVPPTLSEINKQEQLDLDELMNDDS